MVRYSVIASKNKREIVLLKGFPCTWGGCTFCDYVSDNETDPEIINEFNFKVLTNVTGEFGVLEVINSGSVFELPAETLEKIRKTVCEKNIKQLIFESYFTYRSKLDSIRDFFGIPVTFKCGIETFDNDFRNKVLKKGFYINDIKEVSDYFDSVCLMVGIKGQTKEMIENDISILTSCFESGCINIYNDNSTAVKQDKELIGWFKEKYGYLNNDPRYDMLWNNTDFGVGGVL